MSIELTKEFFIFLNDNERSKSEELWESFYKYFKKDLSNDWVLNYILFSSEKLLILDIHNLYKKIKDLSIHIKYEIDLFSNINKFSIHVDKNIIDFYQSILEYKNLLYAVEKGWPLPSSREERVKEKYKEFISRGKK